MGKNTRIAGFYWVLLGRDWEVGFWSDDHWLLVGDFEKYQDNALEEIGQRIPQPNQNELFRLNKPSLIDANIETSSEENIDAHANAAHQRMEIHQAIVPSDRDWGLFCYGDASPGAGGGVGAFYWFHSYDEMLSFIPHVLPFNPPGPIYDNAYLKQKQVGVIVDAMRIKAISAEQGLHQLNKALMLYSQIEWWGTFHELTTGKSNFTQKVIKGFEDSHLTTLTRPLNNEQRQEWLNFLSEYGV